MDGILSSIKSYFTDDNPLKGINPNSNLVIKPKKLTILSRGDKPDQFSKFSDPTSPQYLLTPPIEAWSLQHRIISK